MARRADKCRTELGKEREMDGESRDSHNEPQ